jgi:hypothetical protein
MNYNLSLYELLAWEWPLSKDPRTSNFGIIANPTPPSVFIFWNSN